MNRMKTALFFGLALGLVLVGCGKQVGAGTTVSSSGAVSVSGTASGTESGDGSAGKTSGTLPPEGTPVPEPDESLPFYLAGTTDERDASAAPYNPEGLAAIPGEELRLEENSSKAAVGETVTVSSSLGLYDLTVEQTALIDERVEGFPADRVLRVTYTYASTDYDDDLMVSSLFFRLYDGEKKACAPYIFGGKKEKAVAKPLKPGEICTANVYFVLPDSLSSATLVFDDIAETRKPAEYYWELSV